jgi:uncharacterized C2H2 Zn-finger protein
MYQRNREGCGLGDSRRSEKRALMHALILDNDSQNDIFLQTKNFKCPLLECKKMFKTKSDVERHFKIHSENLCPQCGKYFLTSAKFKWHQKSNKCDKSIKLEAFGIKGLNY